MGAAVHLPGKLRPCGPAGERQAVRQAGVFVGSVSSSFVSDSDIGPMAVEFTAVAEPEEPNLSISITIPLDSHSCVRSECPNCGLEFKQDMAEHVLHDLLGWTVGRVLHSEGVGEAPQDSPSATTTCPYCAHKASSQDFLHAEHVAYIKRLVFREYVEPMISRMFESTFGSMRSNEFIKVTTRSGPKSVRPILGPEDSGMIRVRCLACSTLFKVSVLWRGSVYCVSCSRELLPL